MFNFKCPVCGELLHRKDRQLCCANNHCFDLAKQGYVNLLQSQKSSKKRHGDDTLMINSRRDFLDKGYYNCLCDALIESVASKTDKKIVMADLGCGECWYTDRIVRSLISKGIECDVCGIDISKTALIAGSKRNKDISLAVASTASLPIADEYCDVVISVFAPCNSAEIHRILKKDGVWIKAFPLEKHLMGLKSAIYSKPYENEIDNEIPDGFTLGIQKKIQSEITLDNSDDIMNLFRMTPYYYKTGIADQTKIAQLQELVTLIEFGINEYLKK